MNTKNKVLTALLLFFITLEVLIALDYVVQQRELRTQRVKVYRALIKLEDQIGYVGLIHNFKNAIIRPENDTYRQKALTNYHAALKQVELIEQQGKIILGQLHMTHTRAMLIAYYSRLLELPELLKTTTNIKELDDYLRYDDNPSHSEITQISDKLSLELENHISDTLFRSMKAALFTFIALFITLIAIIRYFFLEQHKALEESERLNSQMEQHKTDILRSQSVLLSVMEDVEQEKQQTLALNHKLQNKNKEMEQFIYTVSHDLKSPLVTINGFSNLLKKELADTLTEKQAHRLNRISENVEKMEDLLTDLLDLSKIVQQEVTKTKLALGEIIEAQCQLLENEIHESGAQLNIAKNLHDIFANERLLAQCLSNLISNAIRYREVTRPLIIDISTSTNENSTMLHIQDNGIGIDPKYHELVFAIFERLESTVGTGVGLTIVATIMEKHHGHITINSNVNEGCCFTLEFPNESI